MDNFTNHVLRKGVAVLCDALGWNSAQSTPIDILSDLWRRQLTQVAKVSVRYATHYGRTEVTLDDMALTFSEMGLPVHELEEYVQNFDPVTLPFDIPNFPIPKESHLNFLRPGSEEVLSRPVHVHEYMPTWHIPPRVHEDGVNKCSKITQESTPRTSSTSTSDNENDSSLANKSKTVRLESGTTNLKPKSPLGAINIEQESLNMETSLSADTITSNGVKESVNSNQNLESPSSTPPQLNGAGPATPYSAKTNKRLESPNESAALKRVRVMIEEEGYSPREVKSAMMTTSGFLTSSIEGRLPDSRPPPNRDFFDPPPVETKKKIPTMKRIVEGIKKLDREKENQAVKADDGNEEENEAGKGKEYENNLFGTPDKIQKVIKSVKVNEEQTSSSTKLKRTKVKVKELRKSSKKFKSLEKTAKEKKKLLKRSEGESSKLRLAKKRRLKEKVRSYEEKDEDSLEIGYEAEDYNGPSKKAKFDMDDESIKEKALLFRRASKKAMEEKIKKQERKLKAKRAAASEVSGGLTPSISSASSSQNIADLSFDEPTTKKKRGRPKKMLEESGDEFINVPPLFSSPILIPDKTRPLKIAKLKKTSQFMSDQDEVNMFTPEISINVSKYQKPPPPPPEFNLMVGRMNSRPGLIPANLSRPPPSMRPANSIGAMDRSVSHFTPEVSLTPLSSKEMETASAGTINLPPSVCSSITITRINMADSPITPSPPSGSLSGTAMSISITKETTPRSSVSPNVSSLQHENNSGITITPIVMKHSQFNYPDQVVRKTVLSGSSAMERLNEDVRTKEERRRDREKRKELKKEKKKEKKLKGREKEKHDKFRIPSGDKLERKAVDSSERIEKKKKSTEGISSSTGLRMEGTVPKLKLKLHSNASTPVDSPRGMDRNETPPPTRKITIKPIEERVRSQSPELARFSPLVTRPAKSSKVNPPLKSSTLTIKTPQPNEMSFPPVGTSSGGGSLKKAKKTGRGRPAKPSQSGLVTETVGFYIDDEGNKVWICPACGRQDDGSPMIGCDTCDDWYHFSCVGITDTPDENEQWFCDRCAKRDSKRRVPKL